MDSVNVIKAASIIYVIPLIALLGGTILSYKVLSCFDISFNIEIISGGIGVLLTILSYLAIKSRDFKFRESRNYIPIITKVIDNIDI